jgi:cell filamentation protein, protein adenylyltransferase
MRVAKRTVNGIIYYYLEHTVRDGVGRRTVKKYLGRKIPKKLGDVKKQFLAELDRRKWFAKFERIKQRYNDELLATPKSAREKALREFAIRFTYNTQRIEGSTLTLRETAELLERQISPGGRPIEDVKEAEAHYRTFFNMLESEKDLSRRLVEDWHYEIFRETKPDVAGRIRTQGVRITGSKFIPPSPVELQALLEEFFGWYNKAKSKTNPVELAAIVHLRFVTIHPFSDGNGRISRLMMNFVLHRSKCPMLNIEHKGRASYYGALERSQLRRDERPFMNWFFRRYLREYRRYL